jgi:uncharacterized delta-60 repeat protein
VHIPTSRLAAGVAALVLCLAAPAFAAAAAGDRDPSFGTNGFTVLDDPAKDNDLLLDLVLLADGRILGGGIRGNSEGFLLARFNANGSPDAGFGSGGIIALPYSGMDGQTRGISRLDAQPDGKILAAGLGQSTTDAFAIARFTADGSGLDPGFNGGAPLVFQVASGPSDALDVAAAPAGKVVAVGQIKPMTGARVAVVRRTATGGLDTSFGSGMSYEAVIDIPGSGSETAYAVEVLADGSMLVGGQSTLGAFLLKLTDAGALDPDFGSGGIAIHDLGSAAVPSGRIVDIQRLPDGRILATGASAAPGGARTELFVARFTAGGDLDATFATGGVLRRDPTVADDEGSALSVLPDGKIVIAGFRGLEGPSGSDVWLLRLRPDGALDPNFGSGGETTASAVPSDDGAYGLAIDPLGRAVIAGDAFDPTEKLLVGRFLADPAASQPGAGGGPLAFGARTLVTLRLAAERIPARGPLKVRVANANGFEITGRLSGQTVNRVALTLKRRIKLKAKAFIVGARTKKTVRLKLPKALRQLLRRKRKMTLRLTAKVKDPAGNTRTVKKRVRPRLKR